MPNDRNQTENSIEDDDEIEGEFLDVDEPFDAIDRVLNDSASFTDKEVEMKFRDYLKAMREDVTRGGWEPGVKFEEAHEVFMAFLDDEDDEESDEDDNSEDDDETAVDVLNVEDDDIEDDDDEDDYDEHTSVTVDDSVVGDGGAS